MPDWTPSLGALPTKGATTFRVWAPDHRELELVINDGTPRRLVRDPEGYWSGTFDDVHAGDLYTYRVDGRPPLPDPASRFQPQGVHGPSQVIDPSTFPWTDDGWQAPPIERLVFYELHVGTFTPEGTFRAAIDRLPYLADLGVTAIELMPVADFPGDRNWGYDGVALFAPARCYGTPDDLRAFIDAAHRRRLAVVLDVVYNHFGPDGAYAMAFSEYYLTDRHESPWGRGVNVDGPHSRHVRRFFIENARHWVHEYHVDGLRLDATHAIQDEGTPHFLAELTASVRASARRPITIVAEDHRNLASMLQPVDQGGWGLDAVWADDLHHELRVHVAGDHDSYYRDFTGTTDDIARTLRQGWFFTGQMSEHLGCLRGTDPSPLDLARFIVCIQNHDQIGNRADGARLNHQVDAAVFRTLSVLLLLAPQTPLLFMGQEWAAASPFLFFTDHHEELGREVTRGRRREFAAFAAFREAIADAIVPDPQDAGTFEASRLNWDERGRPEHGAVLHLYQRTLALRRDLALYDRRLRQACDASALDDDTISMRVGGNDSVERLTVVVRLSSPGSVRLETKRLEVLLTTEDPEFTSDAQPIAITEDGLTFARAGALVLRGPRLAP